MILEDSQEIISTSGAKWITLIASLSPEKESSFHFETNFSPFLAKYKHLKETNPLYSIVKII